MLVNGQFLGGGVYKMYPGSVCRECVQCAMGDGAGGLVGGALSALLGGVMGLLLGVAMGAACGGAWCTHVRCAISVYTLGSGNAGTLGSGAGSCGLLCGLGEGCDTGLGCTGLFLFQYKFFVDTLGSGSLWSGVAGCGSDLLH